MAHELIVRREQSRLVPVNGYDLELLSAIPMGKDLTAKLTMKRSLQQNRFYFAVLGKVVDNHPFYATSRALHVALKVRLGLVESIQIHDGHIVTVVSSTAFDAMDGIEFRTVFDKALLIITTEILPGVSINELLGDAEAMFGAKYDALFPKEKAA